APAGPTKGWPARSSLSPGCSPTSITCACAGPSPNTVWLACFHKPQARQPVASSRRAERLELGCEAVMAISACLWSPQRPNAGQLHMFPDPIEIPSENLNAESRLTQRRLLALY